MTSNSRKKQYHNFDDLGVFAPTFLESRSSADQCKWLKRKREISLRSYHKRMRERSQEEQAAVNAKRLARESRPENRQKKRDRMRRMRLHQDHGIIEYKT